MPKEKQTPSNRRRYAQMCPLARALDAVGERWSLLIIRNLLVGPQRYGELLDSLPGITTNLLAKRLRELQSRALLKTRRTHGVTLYELTPRGRALEHALLALSDWGDSEEMPEDGYKNLRWVMLGLRRRYRGGVEGVLRIKCSEPESVFILELTQEELRFRESFPREVDLTLFATEQPFFELLYGKTSSCKLESKGMLQISGDNKLLEAFLRATLPQG